MSRKYAFIVPRFGESIAGGAETLVGNLASRLAERGTEVEVFTTCAKDNRTWENEFPAGEATEYGVKTHRFAVDERDLDSWIPKQIHISEGMNLSIDDQLDWMEHSVNSSALYARLAEEKDNFDAFIFAPYLFGTTFWGSLINPQKSFLIPCLHDEHYAYTDVIQSMFRQISGCLFNAFPEQELASRLYGTLKGGEVGMGFELPDAEEVKTFEPYFDERFPYILYLGRKETGKNAQLLIDRFLALKEQGVKYDKLKLVIAGGGSFSDLQRPDAEKRDDIIDLSHVSEKEKQQLLKHAMLLCQPSVNESFSIVIMEAWMVGTPVLVHTDCAVTRHHVTESEGGLHFRTETEFKEAIGKFMDKNSDSAMAKSGYEYVKVRYDWSAVLERFDTEMGKLLSCEVES